jgi:hypothetical protein
MGSVEIFWGSVLQSGQLGPFLGFVWQYRKFHAIFSTSEKGDVGFVLQFFLGGAVFPIRRRRGDKALLYEYAVVKERAGDCRRPNTSSVALMIHRESLLSRSDFSKLMKIQGLQVFIGRERGLEHLL